MAMPYAYFEGQNLNDQNRASEPVSSRLVKSNSRKNTASSSRGSKTAQKLEAVEVGNMQSMENSVSMPENQLGKSALSAKAKAEAEVAEQQQKRIERLAELEAKRDNLIDRLDMGAVRIQEARAEGKDVTSWEDFWLQLLRSYEQVCDELRDLALQQ